MTKKEKAHVKEIISDMISADSYVPRSAGELYASVIEKTPVIEDDYIDIINEMYEEYAIMITKNREITPASKSGFFNGRFQSSGKGFGFVIPADSANAAVSLSGDYFVPADCTFGAMSGDEVVARKIDEGAYGYGKGSEARVFHILTRAHESVIGTFAFAPVIAHKKRKKGAPRIAFVTPDSDRLKFKVIVTNKNFGGAKEGQKVKAKITEYPADADDPVYGKVTDILGDAMSREANYESVLMENNIKTAFPDAVIKDAAAEASQELTTDGRLDIRDKVIFTIDGADAKDLDDAISLETDAESNYILGVHIADVSHYVKARSSVDNEAFERGTSVYFTDKVVPMLPESLSNGSCSLNGGVDRYALSAFITLDKGGNILSADIKNTLMHSKVRGVYSEINDIFDNGASSEFYGKYEHVMSQLNEMHALYEILADKSKQRGSLDFEMAEAKIVLDESGFPVDVVKRERGTSERVIEQFMLCANMAVATWLNARELPCVYRIHEEPDPEKIRVFATFAHNLGIDVSVLNAKKILPSHLKTILEQAAELNIAEIVSGVMLRSMMKAKYSDEAKGHFGLAAELYCHFTSPIRRYPDLSVHRIVKTILAGESSAKKIASLTSFANKSAAVSTENEVKAVMAERQINDLYTALYMTKHIGEEFNAVICSVTPFGFFARTDNLCEGLIPAPTLGADLDYDEKNFTLKTPTKIYRLGDKIKIKIQESDIIHRRITMEYVGER